MRDNTKNPKLIVKNGFFLFFRLLLVLAMAFYTTRLTLQILGDEDYGINNVVGGIISVFAIISLPITSTLQRFFNVEFTKQEIPGSIVFSTSIRIILILSLIMVFLYETIGLYLVSNVLSYPDERSFAVIVIFQVSVITTVISFFRLPFTALLYAKENMGIPAIIEIVSSFLKLCLLFIIPFVSIDVLIVYSFVLLLIGLLQLLFYKLYCNKNYEETKRQKIKNKILQKNILAFAGWSSINAVAGILISYLSNIIINVFGGVLYNTAYGISRQLSNAVVSFSTNVLKAVEPQIISSSVSRQDDYRNDLTLSSIKLCLLGTGFCYVCFLFYGDLLLRLWLGHLPVHVEAFCNLSLLVILFSSLVLPLRTIVLATGKIKNMYLVYGILSVMAIALMFILLKLKFPIITVMYLILFVEIGNFLNVVANVHKLSSLKANKVFLSILPVSVALLIGGALLFVGDNLMSESIVFSFVNIIIAFIIVCIVFYFIALTSKEKKYVQSLFRKAKGVKKNNNKRYEY